jgi:hypothetical protein
MWLTQPQPNLSVPLGERPSVCSKQKRREEEICRSFAKRTCYNCFWTEAKGAIVMKYMSVTLKANIHPSTKGLIIFYAYATLPLSLNLQLL